MHPVLGSLNGRRIVAGLLAVIAIVLGAYAVSSWRAQVGGVFQFDPHVTYATGPSPYGIASGDLNGDGAPDIVVVTSAAAPNIGTNALSVYINNADGTFKQKVDYLVGVRSGGVAIGDVNGDGKNDVVATSMLESSVKVLFGNGDGTLGSPANYYVGSAPWNLALGDLTGDGELDIAVAANEVYVFTNAGNGIFTNRVMYRADGYVVHVAIGDVNSDGKSDVAGTASFFDSNGSSNNVEAAFVMMNNGDGTLAAPAHYSVGPQQSRPLSIAIGELNGDGKQDLAVAVYNGAKVATLMNKGDGTFHPRVDHTTAIGGASFEVSRDMDGDGKLDLVTSIGAVGNGRHVIIMRNKGSGLFDPPVQFTTGNKPHSLTVADFNADGCLDIATPNGGDNTMSVLLCAGPNLCGNGNLDEGEECDDGNSVNTDQCSNQCQLPSCTDGIDQVGEECDAAGGDPICDIRFCGNGQIDPGEQCDPKIPGWEQKCSPLCRVKCKQDFDCPSGQCAGGECVDLCGNGVIDPPICAEEGGVPCPPPSENGVTAVNLPAGVFPIHHHPADVNGDGKLDVVVANYMGDGSINGQFYTGTIDVMLGNGNGTFQAKQTVGTFSWNDGGGERGFDVLDADNDGDADIVVHTYPHVYLLTNNSMTFARSLLFQNIHTIYIRHGDLNGDGDQDLILSGYRWNPGQPSSSDHTFVSYGGVGATFTAPVAAFPEFASAHDTIRIVDFNGDGSQDIIGKQYLNDGYAILLYENGPDGDFVELFRRQQNPNVRRVIATDLTGDGSPDLVLEENAPYTVALINDGHGRIARSTVIQNSVSAYLTAVADPNKDGKPDIITGANQGTEGSNKQLWYAQGNGDGTFAAPLPFMTWDAPPTTHVYPSSQYLYPWVFYANDLEAADYDGDGRMDLSMPHASYSDSASVFFFKDVEIEPCVEIPPVIVCSEPEECDDGIENGQPGKCTRQCTFCSNGVIDVVEGIEEECDEGDENGDENSSCTRFCTFSSLCGNGEIDLLDAYSPWQNPVNRFDVNNNGYVQLSDLASVQSAINNENPAIGPLPDPPEPPFPYIDINGDGSLSDDDRDELERYLTLLLDGDPIPPELDPVPTPSMQVPEECDEGDENGEEGSGCSLQCTVVLEPRLGCIDRNACALVPGDSNAPLCNSGDDCTCDPEDPTCVITHPGCVDNACTDTTDPNAPFCGSDADCTECPDTDPLCHNQCNVLVWQCVEQTLGGCIDCEDKYLKCVNEACTVVEGDEENECSTPDDCIVCNDDGQCDEDDGETCSCGDCASEPRCGEFRLGCTSIGLCTVVPVKSPVPHCLLGDDCCDPADPTCGYMDCNDSSQCVPVSGPGFDRCDSPADCEKCPDGDPNCHSRCEPLIPACLAVPDPGEECTDPAECGHLECINQQCTGVAGPGENECDEPADCIPRLGCTGVGQCESVPSSSTVPFCNNAQDCCDPADPTCGGTRCNEETFQCEPFSGPGISDCASHPDCAPCPAGEPNCHAQCDVFLNQCLAVPDSGEECTTDGDCGHMECQNQACVWAPGLVPNTCETSDECALCGNDIIDDGEQCDDGNDVDDDECNNSCQRTCSDDSTCPCNEELGICENVCGNQVIETGESCDEGPGNRNVGRDGLPTSLKDWWCKDPTCLISSCFDRGDNDHDTFTDDQDPGCWSYDLDGLFGMQPKRSWLASLLAQSGGRRIDPVPPEEFLAGKDDEDCPEGMEDMGEFCGLICEPGDICPTGDLCPENGICPQVCGNQIIDFDLGEECDDGNLDDNDACTNQCRLPPCIGPNCPRCGDGIFHPDLGEQCDGTDPSPIAIEQGCSDNCRLLCKSDDDCEGTCDEEIGLCIPPTCGDGEVNQDWERCDDGDIDNTNLCNNACQPTCNDDSDCESGRCDKPIQVCFPTCGNGHVDADEMCDDGNIVDDDACNNQCVLHCTDDLTCDCDEEKGLCNKTCGNGRLEPGEGCDDGNNVDRDECSNRCQVRCRPGTICPDEQACPQNGLCPTPGFCGDGIVDGTAEQCDDGNNIETDGCSTLCRARCSQNLECPNGLLCVGEECTECSNSLQCDTGFCVDGRCRPALPICGNGQVEPGEVCDDANVDDSDGCTSTCLFPINHACAASAQCSTRLCEGSVCTACQDASQCVPAGLRCTEGNCLFGGLQCGDGTIQAGEACDDGNIVDQDECTSACLLPFGAECNHALQCASTICSGGECTPCRDDVECASGTRCAIGMCLTDAQMSLLPNICGNGLLEADEECDDGNNAYGDGCTPGCYIGNSPSRLEVAANMTVRMPFGEGYDGSADSGYGYGYAANGNLHAGAGDGLSDTGPATIAMMAAGAAAGTAWVRRRVACKKH